MIRISYLPPISPMRNTPFLRNYILTDELFGVMLYTSVRFGSITVITSDIRLTPSLLSTVVTPVAESRHAGRTLQTRHEGDTIGTGEGSTPLHR